MVTVVGASDVGMAKKQRTVMDREAVLRETVQAQKDSGMKAEEERRQAEKEAVREEFKPKPAICLLCKRKFNSEATLRLHEEKSDLHKRNLEKAADEAAAELGC